MSAKQAPIQGFPKTARLLKHADFEKVYKTGRRHFSGNMTVFFLRRAQASAGPEGPARVGFTVGRALGPAAVRNRIRRRVREAVRQHLFRLTAPVDVVINPKKTAFDAAFTQLADEVQRAFVKVEASTGTQNES
ncbi:MAG TPA: ribonuclease P protein component [Terriglobales bacterium]|nr:ribonuclease P protein component [Terriglobales bacterium]